MSTGTTAPSLQDGGDGAQQKAQQVAEQAQERAQEAAEQAKGKLREQLDQRSSQAATQINEQASDLRAVGNTLREQGNDGPAQAADRLAEYAEKVGGYLREKDSQALLNDAEDLARRQPWAVGAGALALGFAAARFLKASSRERYSSRVGSSHGGSGTLGRPNSGLGGADGSGGGVPERPVGAPSRPLPTSPPPASPPPARGPGGPAPGVIPSTGI